MKYVPLGQIGRLRFNVEDRNGSAIAPTTMGTITLRSRSPLGIEAEQPTPGEAVTIVAAANAVATYTAEVATSDASLQASGFFAIGQAIGGAMAGLVADGETLEGWLDDEFRIVSAIEPPGELGISTGWFVAIGTDGQPKLGAWFQIALIDGDDEPGFAHDTTPRDLFSGSEGVVQVFLLRRKRYEYWPGGRRKEAVQFDVPDVETFPLPELVGDF